MNEVCAFMFHKYPMESPIPYLIEYKMNFLLKNMFWHELFAIFSPDTFETDLFKLMKTRDCGVYTSYFMPCGLHGKDIKRIKTSHLGWGTRPSAVPIHPELYEHYDKLLGRTNFVRMLRCGFDMHNYWCHPEVYCKWWNKHVSSAIKDNLEQRD